MLLQQDNFSFAKYAVEIRKEAYTVHVVFAIVNGAKTDNENKSGEKDEKDYSLSSRPYNWGSFPWS